MKRWILFSLATLMSLALLVGGCGGEKAAAPASSGGAKVLRVGTNADFAPFEFQDVSGKEYQGFDMDLIRAIAKEMGYQADIQNINFDGLIPAMESGNLDVIISGMSINDERKQKVDFSEPYYKSGLTIVVKKDNTAINKFNDLAGKKVAVQIGTTSAKEVRKFRAWKSVILTARRKPFWSSAQAGSTPSSTIARSTITTLQRAASTTSARSTSF